MPTWPTRFENLRDLAKLPWFEVREGRLVLADPSIPSAIDMHTHLALAYVRPMALDLRAAPGPAQHYLPAERPIDLEVYMNRNFSREDFEKLSRDLSLGAISSGGMRATHTLPNLAQEMADLKVQKSVLLAIDWPFGLSDNAGAWLRAADGDPNVVVFGSVHPYDRHVERKLDRQLAMGARGVKVHPAVQLVRPDAARCMRFYAACADRDMPVFFHCGPVGIEGRLPRYLSQVRHYERAIAENPRTRFVLGHSGALQMEEGLSLAKRYRNVWLELASQSLSHVQRLAHEAPPGKVVFGTDWPFYHQAVGIAKVLMATEGEPDLRAAVLRENAARLLGLPG
jgi:predicted TIM-barrel fold metal-dependent hydrolase